MSTSRIPQTRIRLVCPYEPWFEIEFRLVKQMYIAKLVRVELELFDSLRTPTIHGAAHKGDRSLTVSRMERVHGQFRKVLMPFGT